MAATITSAAFGRISGLTSLAFVPITIAGNGATYATATGGLPIDLAAFLKTSASTNDLDINPYDIVGIFSPQLSTNGFLLSSFVLGAPTYQTQQPFGTQTSPALPALASVQAAQELATCPCTVRIIATGAADKGAFHEFADGANSDTFVAMLLVARGGNNV
jgi:hypothetical protein